MYRGTHWDWQYSSTCWANHSSHRPSSKCVLIRNISFVSICCRPDEMTAMTVQTPDGLNEECNLLYVTLYGTDMVRVSSCCALKHAHYVFIDRRPTPLLLIPSRGRRRQSTPRAHVRCASLRQPFPGAREYDFLPLPQLIYVLYIALSIHVVPCTRWG